MDGASISRIISSLSSSLPHPSKLSCPVKLGEGSFENWCRRGLWDYLYVSKGAFGDVPEHGWNIGVEQGFCTSALLTFRLGRSVLRDAVLCTVGR